MPDEFEYLSLCHITNSGIILTMSFKIPSYSCPSFIVDFVRGHDGLADGSYQLINSKTKTTQIFFNKNNWGKLI